MLLGGFLEWVMGNLHFKDRQSHFSLIAGGWWLAYGATIHPFFNAFGAYSPDHTNPALTDSPLEASTPHLASSWSL
jgi:hypothetical protein